MRVYKTYMRVKYLDPSDGERDETEFQIFFKNIPTKEQVLEAWMDFCTKGIQWIATERVKRYLPLIEACTDLPFRDHAGFGRPIFPVGDFLQHEDVIEGCYFGFDYHDVLEN